LCWLTATPATPLQVPKTKEGYLYKKGGKKSERPWQKRWVTFNGTELKYFKNKGDKESEALNVVKLGEMIDIKQVSDQDKQHRFDLVVINRVFQFYSESKGEWMHLAEKSSCTPFNSVLRALAKVVFLSFEYLLNLRRNVPKILPA